MENNSYISSDFRLLPGETSGHHRKPRKKRTKHINNALFQPIHTNFRPARKPDPAAPKITRPCTECGRKFWSEKALFGHMRCHPERNWRGIVPPPNARRRADDEDTDEVAACLLMLASGPPLSAAASDTVEQECGFECSSCKKVFGSHQALGGHRASHKNVKGCYAINKDGEELEGCCWMDLGQISTKENYGHKCNICFRVFSSGQALGGHMRCHWEKAGDQPSRVFAFDLNMDAQDEDVSSSGMALDLRLGL